MTTTTSMNGATMNGSTRRNEVSLVERITAFAYRTPAQRNAPFESDAEIIPFPGSTLLLAVTVDSIVEEIAAGLYDDPRMIGWTAVMASASDLAAVGAAPLGIVVSQCLTRAQSPRDIDEIAFGIAEACRRCALPLLGGDTGFAAMLSIGATALGTIDGTPLSRRGASPGDILYASGPLGAGNAFALARMRREGPALGGYRPVARLSQGMIARRYASACIDTSDGAIAALDELIRINAIGLALDLEERALLATDALAVALLAGVPPWTLLAGPHGEYELVFTVPAHKERSFLADAQANGWTPLRLGHVVEREGLTMRSGERTRRIDSVRLRNLSYEIGGSVDEYIRALLEAESTWTEENCDGGVQ